MTSRSYNQASRQPPNKGSSRQNIGPDSADSNTGVNDRFSSVKNSLQTCLGFMDGLCCANLNQVCAEDRQERSRANLRNFMASYDLSYLNSNVGNPHNTGDDSSSHGSSEEEDMHPPPPATFESKTPPSVEKSTTHQHVHLQSILPNSMLPREYGHSQRSADKSIYAPTKAAVHAMNEAYNHKEESSSSNCCHSLQQFHGFDCQQQQDLAAHHAQPRTLPSADTYTTVSLSQSYSTMMWEDDDDEEKDDDDCSSSEDYGLSPVDSVFRKDESMEEASSMEHRDPPSCSPTPSFPTPAAFATKTHEAYQYLLRMTPQNYLHGSGSSSEEEDFGGVAENTSHCRSGSATDFYQCGPIFLQ